MQTAWEDLELGAETGRFTLQVTRQMIEEYVAALEITHPWFLGPVSPYGVQIAPSDMVPKLGMEQLFQDYVGRVIGRNMRAKQEFKFYAPIRPGMVVSAVGKLTGKYEKRGKRFITLEALFVDDEGHPLVLDKRTQYIPKLTDPAKKGI